MTRRLGRPRVHVARTGSTNDLARDLAVRGAPHGTLVTAAEQTAGRGRHGRTWSDAPGRALLASLVLREVHPLLPLAAAVAVAECCGPQAAIKWPNDVLLDGRKVCGILAEGRPQEGWAVLGIGVNVAVRDEDLPDELRATAGTLGRGPHEVEPFLSGLLDELGSTLGDPALLERYRARDALRGRRITWAEGTGVADGIDPSGGLRVRLDAGGHVTLDAGEVHLGTVGAG